MTSPLDHLPDADLGDANFPARQACSNHNITFVKTMLAGLAFECPLGGNPKDCQCHEIRKLPLNQRIAWLANLSQNDCQKIYNTHIQCLAKKEGRDPSNP